MPPINTSKISPIPNDIRHLSNSIAALIDRVSVDKRKEDSTAKTQKAFPTIKVKPKRKAADPLTIRDNQSQAHEAFAKECLDIPVPLEHNENFTTKDTQVEAIEGECPVKPVARSDKAKNNSLNLLRMISFQGPSACDAILYKLRNNRT